MNKRINELYEKAIKQAESLLQDDSKVSGILDESIEKLGTLSDRLYDFQDQLYALNRMVRAWIKREYTDISPKTILATLAALIYFINPFDAIPDFIPVIGYIDDAALIAYVFTLIKDEVDRFSHWEHESNSKSKAEL